MRSPLGELCPDEFRNMSAVLGTSGFPRKYLDFFRPDTVHSRGGHRQPAKEAVLKILMSLIF